MFRSISLILLCAVWNISIAATVHGKQVATAKDRMSAVQIKAMVQSVIETILKEHIEPPTRQQMVLEVIRQLGLSLHIPVSSELGLQISELRAREELYELFATELKKLVGSDAAGSVILRSVESAIDRVLLGGLEIDTRSNVLAEEQMAANRYVGIGVAISALGEGKGMLFNKVFEDGPAANAGIQDNDLLDAVDGLSTKDMPLAEVIQLLRGPIDTTVQLTVQTKGQPSRELKLVRRVVPLKSLEMIEQNFAKSAMHIRVDRFSASSLNELKNIVSKAEATGDKLNTIVLNLQNSVTDNLHYFHLFADGLLDETTLCKVQTREAIRPLKTEEGKVLDDRRVVILYQPGRSEALDLLAQVCAEAGAPVFFWFPNLDKDFVGRDRIELPVMESFELMGTEYFLKISTSRLLDRNGQIVSHGPPVESKHGKVNGGFRGKPLLKQKGSILNGILLELAP